MTPHLGARVSALLDGRLAPEEEERCWAHVHLCHPCRDLVEREGWVKTRLATWSTRPPTPSDRLKSSLLEPARPGVPDLPDRSRGSVVAAGGVVGALGAAVVGVVALGVGPAAAPAMEQRGPAPTVSRDSGTSWLEGPSVRAVRSALRPAVDAFPAGRAGAGGATGWTMAR